VQQQLTLSCKRETQYPVTEKLILYPNTQGKQSLVGVGVIERHPAGFAANQRGTLTSAERRPMTKVSTIFKFRTEEVMRE